MEETRTSKTNVWRSIVSIVKIHQVYIQENAAKIVTLYEFHGLVKMNEAVTVDISFKT
jgi:hypothetical protein